MLFTNNAVRSERRCELSQNTTGHFCISCQTNFISLPPVSQEVFFNHIKSIWPFHLSLVDGVANLLAIWNNRSYRRMRGDKAVTFEELKKRYVHFNISLDSIYHLNANNYILGKLVSPANSHTTPITALVKRGYDIQFKIPIDGDFDCYERKKRKKRIFRLHKPTRKRFINGKNKPPILSTSEFLPEGL